MSRTATRIAVVAGVIIIALCTAVFSFGESHLQKQVEGKSMNELMEQGRNYYRANKLDSAMLWFSVVADKYDERLPLEEKELAVLAMNNVGVISNFNYLDFVQGYDYLSRALELSQKYGWTRTEAIVLLNMAQLYMLYNSQLNTEAFKDKISEYSLRSFNKAYESKSYDCMATVLINLLQFDLSTPTGRFKAIFNSDIPADVHNVEFARTIMKAAEAFHKHDYQNARDIFTRSMKFANAEWNPERELVAYPVSMARTYLAEKDVPSAEKWLLTALGKADSLGTTDQQLSVLQDLSSLPDGTGRKYRTQYLEKKDSVITSGKLAMVGELDFLSSLKKEQARAAELSASRRHLITVICIGAGVLAIVLVFTVVVLRLNSRLRERNRALYQHIQAGLKESEEIPAASPEPPSSAAPAAEPSDKYSGQNLKEERIDEIYRQIEIVMADTETVCNPEFNLTKLAAAVNVNTTYVSRAINEKAGCSFSAFVNARRIRLACLRMDDHANYGNMTIEAISRSVGFSSRNTFVNAFKKANGMTPSEYLKISHEVNGAAKN